LLPSWAGGRVGYLYSVIFGGEVIVSRSADPECDAARALLAKGIVGKLKLIDAEGKPRTIINIEKAAQLSTEETATYPRFRKYRERGGSAASSPGKEAAA
jgi:hypothetical protein